MAKVLDFSNLEWCQSCVKMKPIFDKASKEFEGKNISFEYVDVESDEGVDLSEKYTVRNIPTILIVDENEKELERLCGTQSYEKLVETFNKYVK